MPIYRKLGCLYVGIFEFCSYMTLLVIVNSWIILFVSSRKPKRTENTTESADANIMKRATFFLRKKWIYFSVTLLITTTVFLTLEVVLKSTSITRFSVFFISFLTSITLLQMVLIYVVYLKEKLLKKIENSETNAVMLSQIFS